MELAATYWPVTVIAGYCLIYVSLFSGCAICRVPDISAGRLAKASLIPFIILAAYAWWFASIASSLQYLTGGPILAILFLLPLFLAIPLGAPWLLHSAGGNGWGAEWGASTLAGIFLCIMVILTGSVMGNLEHKAAVARVTVKQTNALAAYGLPCPEDAEFNGVELVNSPEAIAHARENPDYKRWSSTWVERWPCNSTISFKYTQSPAALASFLESSMAQAGFRVQRSGTQCVAGGNAEIFAAYQLIELDGHRCMVRIWKDFAKEMETVCAEEMK